MTIQYLPLEWYADKVERGEPFTSLLYGDGEFQIIAGLRTGQTMAYGEVVTERMAEEMTASLEPNDQSLIRGTDPHLIEPETYKGQDADQFQTSCAEYHRLLSGLRERDWTDGVVWDRASRDGELGPFLRALRTRRVVFVGNAVLAASLQPVLRQQASVLVPESNAWAAADSAEDLCRISREESAYVVCAGLTTIPVIMRLWRVNPLCTYLDLGSALDVFAGIGAERGWRAELYADPSRHQEVVARHLRGLT